jgi:hypothetical protein
VTLGGPFGLGSWAWIAGGAAALAVTAYIIKMRRRRFEVPFARLWQRVIQQREANALWKHLKRVVSLLVALVVLGALLFAALDPTLGGVDRKARSVVVLLDCSASMKTMDENGGSRIAAAKQRAKAILDGMGGGDMAMIMKVDGQATPMSRFSSDAAMLDQIVDKLDASDTPADLPRALGAAADALRGRTNPLLVLVSDGAYPQSQLAVVDGQKNLTSVDLTGIDTRYVNVGHDGENVGIVSFNVRRYIANKASYEVYIEVQNFGQKPAHRTLTLYNGDTVVSAGEADARLDLAPGERARRIFERLPGGDDARLRAVLRPVDGEGGSDKFALDDEAFALLPARKKQKVLMVTEDNLFLEGALLVYDNVDPLKVSPAEYAANPRLADDMDVVVFDDYTPDELPPPPTSLLFFHPTGPHSPIAVRGETSTPHITEIDENHPVLRWVTLSDVYMDKSNVFIIDPKLGESALAYSVSDPIIAARRDGKRKILAFGFSLPATGRESATDLPMRVAFPMLLVNALDWFAGDQSDLLTTYPTGQRQRVPLDGAVGAIDAEVTGPLDTRAEETVKVPVIDGLATFYGAHVGFYDVVAKNRAGTPIAHISLAANLASTIESNIAPSPKLTLGGHELKEPEAFGITHSQKLWIYLLLLAAGLVVVEWVTYHRRITV